ncbi:DUF2492 family protein [Shewanella abyssi]|uniref:DUF2492 family protein n=1 Tax=Shewanella abyssi TaxID=311789 RepID=UPI00201089B1|nr:DUF2492 family protein [Shewanella abyssi]MCL1050923.1 DUF2492 family protein [Shewanella abyssi]
MRLRISNSVHAHEVMALMLPLEKAISKEELTLLMHKSLEAHAYYHTVSARAMTAAQWREFYTSQKKPHKVAFSWSHSIDAILEF